MFYRKLSHEELKKFPYPNLVAEVIESGYSICTVGDHMGLGQHCPEDSPEVLGRLNGEIELGATEAFKLTKLFGAEWEYLFSHELRVVAGETAAHWRWLEENRRKEQEQKEAAMRWEIGRELRDKPYLLSFMKEMLAISDDERMEVTCFLKDLQQKKGS